MIIPLWKGINKRRHYDGFFQKNCGLTTMIIIASSNTNYTKMSNEGVWMWDLRQNLSIVKLINN